MTAFKDEIMKLETDNHIINGINYEDYHAVRLQYIFALCKKYCASTQTKVLDIGRSTLSYLLSGYYPQVSTLGFPLNAYHLNKKEHTLHEHIIFDLNQSQTTEKLDGYEETFDLIVFAEVIEHIYTAPELVIHFLTSFLKPGGLLLCQTPNAASLHKRIKLLLGYHPYERIRYDVTNPGHFREYTKQELISIGRKNNLDILQHHYVDYFPIYGSWTRKSALTFSKLMSYLMPSFSRGQTIIYRKTT